MGTRLRNISLSALCVLSSFTITARTLSSVVAEGDFLQNSGRFVEAIEKFREAESICNEERGFYSSEMRYLFGSIAACAQQLDDYETFLQCLDKIDSIGRTIGYEDELPEEFLCFELCKGFSGRASSDEELNRAKDCLKRGLQISRNSNNREMLAYWDVIQHRINYVDASRMSDQMAAAPILKDEYNYFARECPLPKSELISDIHDSALVWAANQTDRLLNRESLDVILEAESIIRGTQSDFYSLEFESSKMYAYANLSENNECIALGERILSQNVEDAETFQFTSAVRYNLGRAYNGAERYEEGYKVLSSIYSSPYAYILEGVDTNFVRSEMAYSLFGMGRLTQAKELCEKILGEKPEDVALVQANFVLGAIANMQGELSELGYIEDFIAARDELGYGDAEFAWNLLDYARRYLEHYQYDKAIDAVSRAVTAFETSDNTMNIDYCVAMVLQASIYAQMYDVDNYLSTMLKLQSNPDLLQRVLGLEGTDESARDYDKLTYFYEYLFQAIYNGFTASDYFYKCGIRNGEMTPEQSDEAKRMLKSMQTQMAGYITEIAGNEDMYAWLKVNNPDRLSMFFHINALMLRTLGEYQEALAYIGKALEEIPEGTSYIPALEELRAYIMIEEDARSMSGYIKEHYAADIDKLKDMIGSFTSSQRNSMWQQYYGNISNYVRYAHLGRNMPSLNEVAYNSILVGKGLMLQSDIDFESRILRSGDEDVLARYKDWKSETANGSDRAHAIERDLVRMIGPSEDNESFRYTWEDVRRSLKKGEYAVEIRAYEEYGVNQYLAFVLGADFKSPVLVELCKSDELNNIGSGDNFDFKGLSDLVWSRFNDIIPDGSTVYFSPDLQLHSFPLENLPDYADGQRLISQRWNVCRLSSTRHIVQGERVADFDSFDIFGGMEYSFDPAELLLDYNKTVSSYRALPEEENTTLRASITRISDLPGSKREVSQIARIIRDNTAVVNEYTGKRATEARFKAHAGKEGKVLHISTHGFFISPSGAGNRRLANLLALNNGNQTASYDDALKSTGLMMAGVNEIISGRVSSTECEDGLLTAKEISRMNLANVGLAVLSACETGVGVVSGDGVFGLQRGFKLAGVNSIMMSLWKVDDDATEKLMTEFYKNWIDHKNARKALNMAQTAVRNTPGWEHPRYWAGFILLDSLN